jgi:flagellar hook-associated protein 1 FlgK
MAGISTLLTIGNSGLFAAQSSIETTGNNIANVNTPGYHRRSVRLEEQTGLTYYPGSLGLGVNATEVVRSYDAFVEASLNSKTSDTMRWQSLYENLRGVDSLFNEANGYGISAAMNTFFADWEDLALRPDSYPSREALLLDAENLVSVVRQANENLQLLQYQAESYIDQEVGEINDLMGQIAEINQHISQNDIPGVSNANELYDKRDLLVRELSEKIDIKVVDNGGSNLTIMTQAGQVLVDGQQTFRLAFEGPQSTRELTATSQYKGDIAYSGTDEFEYTVRVMKGGAISSDASGAGVARFEVSFDGGKTWDRGEDGQGYLARTDNAKITIRNLEIGFGVQNDPAHPEYDQLTSGDVFNIVPKNGLYWYKTSSSKENITPQLYANGQSNPERVTGGTLAGYFNFRDNYVGKYRDRLDGMVRALTFEVNRLHSQGAGLDKLTELSANYAVSDPDRALGSNSSGLAYGDRLQSGNVTLYVYDQETGELVSNAALDFSDAAGLQNFDPESHSLASCAAAVNRSFGGLLTATILNGKLEIRAADGYEFNVGSDTAGLFAGLGLNCFFDGSNSADFAVDLNVAGDTSRISTGHVNGAGEANSGDNTTALSIANLSKEKIQVTTLWEGTQDVNLLDFYNSLVTEIGADTANAQFSYKYQKALADDLNKRQQEVSGVSLDEEMSDLIKFQHSYTAAAKLISTADQMLQTLLGLKQ